MVATICWHDCLHRQILVSHPLCAICGVSTWLSVSSAHSGRQLGRPGPRRRPAGLRRHGEMLRLINRKQFCLNNLQTWNWFQKIHYKSSTQCHTTFQIETTCNLGNHSIDLSNAWLDLSLKKTSNHSMALSPAFHHQTVESSNHIWLFHHQTIYGCFTTTTSKQPNYYSFLLRILRGWNNNRSYYGICYLCSRQCSYAASSSLVDDAAKMHSTSSWCLPMSL